MRETCPSYVRIRQLVSCSWTWHLSVPLSFSWVICLLLSRINVMCHFTSSTPSKNVIKLSVVNLSWSILISQCCQVSCRAVQCSRVKLVIFCQPLQYVNLCVSLCSIILSHQSLITGFVSSMWDSSWPSFDGFVPVDFRSLSRSQI